MTWSYSGNPSDSGKDAVRYLVGDVDADEAFVLDEEIDWALVQANDNIYAAAASVAFNLSVLFATKAEQTKIGPLTETYQTRSKRYAEIATRMEKRASSKTGFSVEAGGITNGTTRDPIFTIGMHDFPEE